MDLDNAMKASFSILILALCSLNSFASEENSMSDVAEILKEVVDTERKSAELVGLGGIVVQGGEIIGLSVSGERKKGSGSFVTARDKWHIGSITKSFTATMIARLIEKGDLSWDTTIGDVFADGNQIHSGWNNVTLGNLLAHTSGAPPNFSFFVNFKKPEAGIERMEARELAVRDILAEPPESAAGTIFVYSNIGYTIAGVIAEKKAGVPWENLIIQEVFSPLGLNSGGFGAPKDTSGKLSQPWGHKNMFGLTVSTKSDNTPIVGPAGTIHISLKDLALYANEHLKGMQGLGSILKRNSFQRLHHPNLNNYASGWVIGSPKDVDVGRVHWHNGSNTMWYSLIAILPDSNAVICITSNDGRLQAAEQASWNVIRQLAEPLAVSHNKSINSDTVNSASY